MNLLIAPSILACDFARLGEECLSMQEAGADMLHVDIMDGHFVPNLTFGPGVVAALRPRVALPLDVHLMLSHPARYAGAFLDAGADILTFHIEAEGRPEPLLAAIRGRGARAGLVVKPATPVEAVFPFLALVDVVMVMTVEPGFGGQEFQAGMLPKVAALRAEAARRGLEGLRIEVDGGVNGQTAPLAAAAGADVLVAGSALFAAADRRQAVAALRAAAGRP